VQSLVPGTIGAFPTFSAEAVYAVYAITSKPWGLTALSDQQLAGVLMKLVGSAFLWVIVGARFYQWYQADQHEAEKTLDDRTALG
jgi:cytochrome c oxidase assembly factor CtaG